MAKPQKRPKKKVTDGEIHGDPIKRMIGTPDPSLQYLEDASRRLMSGAWPVLVVVGLLYFWYRR